MRPPCGGTQRGAVSVTTWTYGSSRMPVRRTTARYLTISDARERAASAIAFGAIQRIEVLT